MNQCQGGVSGMMCHRLSACVWHVLYVMYVCVCMLVACSDTKWFLFKELWHCDPNVVSHSSALQNTLQFPQAQIYFMYFSLSTSAPKLFSNEWLNLFTSKSLRSAISSPESQWSKSKNHLRCAKQMDTCNK